MTNRISELLSPAPGNPDDPSVVAKRKALEIMQRTVERLHDPDFDVGTEISRTGAVLGLIGHELLGKQHK